MPTYDYECKKCNNTYEVIQSMMDDKLEVGECPTCEKETPCTRLIGGGCGPPIWKGGDSKRQISKTRGYTGKYGKKLRPVGTGVDAPVNKGEADKQFNKWIDSGGLDGIKPSFSTNNPGRPQTTAEQVDSTYKPK